MVGERRVNRDRRINDIGPPLYHHERRKSPERRLPEVTHIDFSEYVEVVSVSRYYDEDFPPPR